MDPGARVIINHARDLAFRPRVRYAIQDVLHSHSLTLEIGEVREEQTATLYQWFQRSHYYNDKGTGGSPNRRFDDVVRKWLGVDDSEYYYDLEIDLDGLVLEASLPMNKKIAEILKKHARKLPGDAADRISKWIAKKANLNVGIRAFTGTLTVKTRGRALNWEATYWVFFTAVGGGLGGGEQGGRWLGGRGTATSALPWDATHFDGSITVLAGEAARDRGGNLRDDQLVWIAEGSHPAEPSIQMLFDAIDTNLSASDLGIGWGKILDPNTIEDAPPTPTEPKIFRYTAKHARMGGVHFMLGSATVLEDGRKLVRLLAANELSALREGSCVVTFHGFADRLGGTGYNDVLSQMRAENTKTALLDCLTGSVTTHMTVQGHGERTLELLDEVFDFPDQSPSPEWRRVFVLIHGVASIELTVRDLKDVE
jgi:outer membrane protein OmpA-like peptidoglycan-associated protein